MTGAVVVGKSKLKFNIILSNTFYRYFLILINFDTKYSYCINRSSTCIKLTLII